MKPKMTMFLRYSAAYLAVFVLMAVLNFAKSVETDKYWFTEQQAKNLCKALSELNTNFQASESQNEESNNLRPMNEVYFTKL